LEFENMKYAIPMLLIIAIGLFIAVVDELTRKRRLRLYWRRACVGADWRRCFPDASKEEIRSFLQLFSDAFMFDRKNRLKFTPQDKLMDVYRLMYPLGNFADAMELETFADTLDRQYEVDLTTLDSWEHITLGQLFEMTRNKKLHAIVK
jgi:propanediol dehydratase small subunit